MSKDSNVTDATEEEGHLASPNEGGTQIYPCKSYLSWPLGTLLL